MRTREEDIHQWAELMSFEELSLHEQSIVLEEMTREEFNDLHELLSAGNSELLMDPITIDHTQLNELKSVVRSKNIGTRAGVWTYKLPWYWTAAACLLVFLLSYFTFRTSIEPEIVTKEKVVEQLVVDTVYIETPIIETVVKKVYVPVEKPEPQRITTDYSPENIEFVYDLAPVPSMNGVNRSFGNSTVDKRRLEQFKVEM